MCANTFCGERTVNCFNFIHPSSHFTVFQVQIIFMHSVWNYSVFPKQKFGRNHSCFLKKKGRIVVYWNSE